MELRECFVVVFCSLRLFESVQKLVDGGFSVGVSVFDSDNKFFIMVPAEFGCDGEFPCNGCDWYVEAVVEESE